MKTAWFTLTLFCISFSVSAQESEQQIAFDSCKSSFSEVLSVFEDCVTYENNDQVKQCFDQFIDYCTYESSKMPKHVGSDFYQQAYEYAIHTLAHKFRTENDRDTETYLQDSHRYTSKMQLMAFIELMCFENIHE